MTSTNDDADKKKVLTLVKSIDERQLDFADLLIEIEGIKDKKKALYLEIYRNSVSDRENAAALLKQLMSVINAGVASTEFATHGRTVVALIEKQTKSNDQLLKLADILGAYDKPAVSDLEITDDEVYASLKATS